MERRRRGLWSAGAWTWTALFGCGAPSFYTELPVAPSDAASVLFAVDEPSFGMFAAEPGGPLWVPFDPHGRAPVYLMYERSSLASLHVVAGPLSPAPSPSAPAPAPTATFASAIEGGALAPWQAADYASTVPPRVQSVPLPLPMQSGCERFEARQLAVDLGASLFDAIVGVDGAFVIAAHEASTGKLLLLRAEGDEVRLVERSAVDPGLTSLAFDGSSVWGGSADGRLFEISPDARRLGPPLALSSTTVRVASSPAGEIVAYDDQKLWRVLGGAGPRVERLPAPPHGVVRASLGPGGRAIAHTVVPSPLGKRLRVSLFDGQSWVEQTPTDASEYSGTSDFTAVVAGDRGFALLGWLQVWQRDYGGGGWRALAPPALGPGLAGWEIRYLAPMNNGGLVVTGGNGVVDILRPAVGASDDWCQVRSGSVRAYDGIAVLPDQSALMLIYNAFSAEHVLRISVPR